MAIRYVVTGRNQGEEVAIPERDDVTVVAALDRGVLVDADAASAEELEAAGLRVKALPDPHVITIFSYRINTQSGTTPDLPEELTAVRGDGDTESEGEDPNHLVQLVGPAQESWLAVLAGRGVRVVDSVGPFAYFVRAEAATVAALPALPFVAWTGRLEPGYKVNPVLLGIDPGDAAANGGDEDAEGGLGEIEAVDIGVLADGDVDGVAARVQELGGTVQSVAGETADAYRSITAQLPADALAAIAAHHDVRWIDAVRAPVLEDERAAQITYEDLDAVAAPDTGPVTGYAANLAGLGVDGTGVTIAICDTGIDTNAAATVHADLAGRLAFAVDATGAALSDADSDGHGTHVAGIVAGDGGSGDTDPQGFVLGLGAAPGALVGSLFLNGTRQQRIQTAAEQGADVMNNSYALDGSSYGSGDRTFDLGVRDADPTTTDITQMVIVFSAGNSGPGGTSCTKAVKNAFVVGNSLNSRPGEGDIDDIRGLRASSSRGPAGDGRLLPDLVAPGTDVVSARSGASARAQYTDTAGTIHADHTRMTGTSMAAPVISGTCGVLIDWWRQTRGGATPSPALLKALLVVSAESAAGGPDRNGGTIGAGPTNDAGWGRVSLENTLLQAPASDRGPKIFVDQRHAFTASGQEYRIRVGAADPTRPLRVALAWTDAAGAVGANPALVNDLDLEVVENGTGNIFRGNVFTGGFSATGGTADSLNNLECAFVQNPSGVYEIAVVAANVASSARPDIATPWQDFALVIDNGEVPSADPVSVVTVIDRSGSMEAFGYIDVTRQTSRQFLDLTSVDDAVGVVSFGDAATQEYPPSGGPQLVTGQPVRDAATNAVDGIAFGGCTFMGDGIATGGSMLASAGSRRALVLLSDGYDNKGCDPSNPAKPSALDAAAALPADLPVYSCAMGPASDQDLLARLADDTDGRYYFMPTIDDLFEIYNFIRGQVTGDGVIVNESSTASRSTVTGFVDGCAESALFTVAWHDESLRHIHGAPKGRTDIAVRLRSPRGRWLPYSATEVVRTVGSGYVSLELQDPEPGPWTVEVATARDQHTRYTVGGFVRSDIGLRVDAPARVLAGQPIDVRAVVRDGRGPVDGLKVATSVSFPRRRIHDVLRELAHELDDVRLPDGVRQDRGRDPQQLEVARLVLLRDAILADSGRDILGRGTAKMTMSAPPGRLPSPVPGLPDRFPAPSAPPRVAGTATAVGMRPVSTRVRPATGTLLDWRDVLRPRLQGVSTGRFDATRIAGSYTLAVTAHGFSPSCGSRFVRRDLVSVVVADRG